MVVWRTRKEIASFSLRGQSPNLKGTWSILKRSWALMQDMCYSNIFLWGKRCDVGNFENGDNPFKRITASAIWSLRSKERSTVNPVCPIVQPVSRTHTHNSRPSESYGPRGTWENTATKHQRSKHHCTKIFSWELHVSLLAAWHHDEWQISCAKDCIWWSQRFAGRPIRLLVGIPFTCNRGPKIHSRCNLRCKTKSPIQQSLNPWSNIENLLCIFQYSVHFLHQLMPIIVHQGCPSNNWT